LLLAYLFQINMGNCLEENRRTQGQVMAA
jgi:hypothetical protein